MKFVPFLLFIIFISSCQSDNQDTSNTNSNTPLINSKLVILKPTALTANIENGQSIFMEQCINCHTLENSKQKFYLGVTFHLTELSEFIHTSMPYNNSELCNEQCAIDVATYIQYTMCFDNEQLELCNNNIEINSSQRSQVEFARGKVKFKYECSQCHNISPEATIPENGTDLFTSNSQNYFAGTVISYIEKDMPANNPKHCDKQCAQDINTYLQQEFCSLQNQYAFCDQDDSAIKLHYSF